MAVTTTVDIRGENFLVNGTPTYSEIPGSRTEAHGLLFNARFIQGIFDDAADPGRFARFGFETWDPEDHTDRLIAALPAWYGYGLRAFTVGIQGGGPCFTINNSTIHNNAFGPQGDAFDKAYAGRLDRLIRGADEIGMVVIVSFFYGHQAARLVDGRAVRRAVTTASRFLRDGRYTNVLIEVANEQNVAVFASHPLIREPEGMAVLIDLAREESGGMPVGSSGNGGSVAKEIVEASDVVLIHGNSQTRQHYYNLIRRTREWALEKPIVCNEDSQAIGQLVVADHTHTSWGYYNNMTKQEPPARWSVLAGEDTFFALRMAEIIGIDTPQLSFEDEFYLHGFEPEMTCAGERWIRLASLRPEIVDFVEFYRNGKLYYIAYDEPYSVHFRSNWMQGGVTIGPEPETWQAVVHRADGRTITKQATAEPI
jgi:hypothetical protein